MLVGRMGETLFSLVLRSTEEGVYQRVGVLICSTPRSEKSTIGTADTEIKDQEVISELGIFHDAEEVVISLV
jgi:hypothetical protein